MRIEKRNLKHFEPRDCAIDMIVIHCSALNSSEMYDCLDRLGLSAHYLIGLDGEIVQTVDEKNKAWHAGISFWRGAENINSRSIGIEISNLFLGQGPYFDVQIKSLELLLKDITTRYSINPKNIVGHSDIAPLRKPDPGIFFPWKELSEKSLGLWYDLDDADKIDENDVRLLLFEIGYDVRDEERTIASSYAFRRRFLPQEVEVDEDINHLVDCVYPVEKKSLLTGELFLRTLKAVAYKFSQTK